jgi:hypothetical protein
LTDDVDDPQPDRHAGKIAIRSEFLGSLSAFQLGRLAVIFATVRAGRDQRTGRQGHEPARLGCFSLKAIDAVPLGKIEALNERA